MITHGPIKPEVRQALLDCVQKLPVFKTLAFELLELQEGLCHVKVPKQMCYAGLYQTFHGGIMATVADCIAWVAIATILGPSAHMATSDLHIRYLAPCMTDLHAQARVIKIGRTLCPVHVDLKDQSDTPVGLCQVTYFRLQNNPEKII